MSHQHMNNRKLQGEIDKTLKRVGEGIIEFDSILKKVYSATSTNQKEKYETDLKKEIKKLQRYRDQIKTWIGSNDVKQKNQLLEARKSIEFKMEQFKACEKDTKSRNKDTDSSKDEMAKSHVRNWVGKAITTLRDQEVQFENELENIPTRKRKTEASRVESLQKYLKNHKYHYLALEHLLRKMDNDRLHHDELENIKDSVECYVDTYEKEENYEDPEDVYSIFNLKMRGEPNEDYDFSGSEGESENDDDDDDDDGSVGSSDSEEASKTSETTTTNTKDDDKISETTTSSTADTESITSNTSSTTSSSNKSSNSTTSVPTTSTVTSTGLPNQPRISSPVTVQPTSITPVNKQATPSPNLTSVNNTTILNKKEIQQKQPTPQPNLQPTPVPSTSTNTSNPSNINFGNMSMSQRLLLQQQAAQQQQLQQQQAQQQQQQAQQQLQQQQQPQQPISNQQQSTQTSYQVKNQYSNQSNSYQDTSDLIQDSFSQMNLGKQESSDDSKNNDTFYNSGNVYSTGTLADISSSTMSQLQQQAVQQQVQQQQQAQHTMIMSPQMGILPSTPPLHQQLPSFEESLIHTRNMMDISHKNLPDFKDYERVPTYIPKTQKPTPNYYPQIPLAIFESPNIFEKFDIDTLFFIFYFKQGTYQQYQAAKELKKQGWRYHKKYLTWFRRHEEPKEITHEYEQGTYVYFDYETGWCQRKKTEFTFEYRYLEE